MVRKKNKKFGRKGIDPSESLSSEAYKVKVSDNILIEAVASVESTNVGDALILLYGQNKIGKTTLCSLIPDSYFIPTEPGYKWLKVRKTYCASWKMFKAIIKEFETNPKKLKNIQTFIVDTADNLAKFCQLYVCGREQIVHPSDLEWGKGWDAYRSEWQYWILRLVALDKGIVFVCHESEKEVISRSIRITKSMPFLQKGTFEVLNDICDQVIRMGFNLKKISKKKKKKDGVLFQESRCLYTKPKENMEAGDRLGILPDMIFFDTEQEAINKLQKYFKEYSG